MQGESSWQEPWALTVCLLRVRMAATFCLLARAVKKTLTCLIAAVLQPLRRCDLSLIDVEMALFLMPAELDAQIYPNFSLLPVAKRMREQHTHN